MSADIAYLENRHACRPSLVSEYDQTQLLGAVVNLLGASPIHRTWSVGTLYRLIMPPIWLGQCFAFADGEDRLVGWFSWADLTDQAAAGFADSSRKLQAEDWAAGDHSRIWIVDGVAPWGGLSHMARVIRQELSARASREGWSARRAHWKRTILGQEVQHVGNAGAFEHAI